MRVAQLIQTQVEDVHRRQRPPAVSPTHRTEYNHRHAHEHDNRDDKRHAGAHQLLDGPAQRRLHEEYVLVQVDHLQQIEYTEAERRRTDDHESVVPVGDHVEADVPCVGGRDHQSHRPLDGQLAHDVGHRTDVREENDHPVDEEPHGEGTPASPACLRRLLHEPPRLAYGEEEVGNGTRHYPHVSHCP